MAGLTLEPESRVELVSEITAEIGALMLESREGLLRELGSVALPGNMLLEVKRARRACMDIENTLREDDCLRPSLSRALYSVDATLHRVEREIVRGEQP